jgi:hypothetical protein
MSLVETSKPKVLMSIGQWQKNIKLLGPNKLNFYFYLIFFNFLEKKKFHLLIFLFFLGNWGGGHGPASPPSLRP